MILEVQIQISVHARQSFHFEKFPARLNINIFCENRHEPSFYIKEQTQFFVWKFEF